MADEEYQKNCIAIELCVFKMPQSNKKSDFREAKIQVEALMFDVFTQSNLHVQGTVTLAATTVNI